MQQEEIDRVRGYLLSQGEKRSYVELWPRAVAARLQVLDALEGVTEEQASYVPAPGEWSIREVALHVLNGSRRTQQVVAVLAAGKPATSENVDPPREATDLSIEELRRQLLRDSVDWSVLTDRLPEKPSFDAMARHQFFGELHSRAWYLFQRVHDIDHANQIAAVKQASGYPDAPARRA
ncbi:MAG: DinB family protein [Chloroflexi bacterium]|nr:DinB family protein [Chloroflexota bacterium]